jgi:inhibitor of KinA sporulation pathway (predicted exonuclease)
MLYFIDFEASQFTQEIISIGCVTENNQTFYSLVHTRHKIGNFIQELTGIKQEEINNAPTPDEVFLKFFEWLQLTNPTGQKLQFICYGNLDTVFAEHTLKNIQKFYLAQAALSLIALHTIDYSVSVKNYFGLNKHIGLAKVAQFLQPETIIIQTHNALDDAIMLKQVYECIQQGFTVDEIMLNDYKTHIECYDKEHQLKEVFSSLPSAVNWLMNEMRMPSVTKNKRVADAIKNASAKEKLYCNFYWKIFE